MNPEALEAAQERFEERLDCVIVLRVLTKEEIQKLADKTREIRGKRHRSRYADPRDITPPNGTSPDQSYVDGTNAHKAASTSTTPHLEHLYQQLALNPPPLVDFIDTSARSSLEEARSGREDRGKSGRSRVHTSSTHGHGGGSHGNRQHSLTRDARYADKRYEEERSERKPAPRKSTRNRDRYEHGEYEYSESEDEFKEKSPKMLEAPSSAGASSDADFIRENQRRHDRDRDEPSYISGALGSRDDGRRREEPHSRY